MRRALAAALIVLFLFAHPRPAHADEVGDVVALGVLLIVDSIAGAAATMTALGSANQLGRDAESGWTHGWGLASFLGGILIGISGALTTVVIVKSNIVDEDRGWWAASIVPLSLSAINISFASVNLTRHARATSPSDPEEMEEEEEEYREEDELARAPGISLSYSF